VLFLAVAFRIASLLSATGCTMPSADAGEVVRFSAPVGTAAERQTGGWPPGEWTDANPYGRLYFLGRHTGSDLNLNKPTWDLDRGKPVYAVADGQVIFAGHLPDWGNVIVIRHWLEDGNACYSRYGHLGIVEVTADQEVLRGAGIGTIGRRSGGPYHLHFDLVKSDVLEDDPGHWPGYDLALLNRHYVDPGALIESRRRNG